MIRQCADAICIPSLSESNDNSSGSVAITAAWSSMPESRAEAGSALGASTLSRWNCDGESSDVVAVTLASAVVCADELSAVALPT
jgi:hypothetical protein